MGLDEIARYVAYELAFVIAPGWLVFRAISPGTTSRVWQLALGWPIGLTLEILAFSLTAELGARDAFLAYPIVVAIPAALVLRRRLGSRGLGLWDAAPAYLARACRWAIAGLCLYAFAYIAIAYYAENPLPGSVAAVSYNPDLTFHIALAAEALHHWPIEAPNVVGQPLHYHYFAHIHLAAISQVTDLRLTDVVFRLYLLPLTALLVMQLALLGKSLTGRDWAAPLTVALFLLVREIDVSIADQFPFAGIGIFHLWESPSQLLGMVIFVPALAVICRMLDPGSDPSGLDARPRELMIVLAVLAVGAGGSKSVILPLLVAALALYLLWRWLRERLIDRVALIALGLCTAAYLLYVGVLYGRETLGLHFDATGTAGQLVPFLRIESALPSGTLLDVAFWMIAIPIGALMYFAAPLLGLIWLRWDPATLRRNGTALCLALLLASLPPFFLIQADGLNQTYFALYGLLAAFPLSAAGLLAFFERPRQWGLLRSSRTAIVVLAWIASVTVLAFMADRFWVRSHPLQGDLLAYGALGLCLAALGLACVLASEALRTRLLAALVLAVLVVAALDTPIDVLPRDARLVLAGDPVYRTQPGLTRDEAEGLEWIRDNLDEDAVLAISHEAGGAYPPPLDSDYPAFSERRTLVEGPAYTTRSNHLGQLDVILGRRDAFPLRELLQNLAIRDGDPIAAAKLANRYGVTHLVIDRAGPAVSPRVRSLGPVVFDNGAVEVIALDPDRLA